MLKQDVIDNWESPGLGEADLTGITKAFMCMFMDINDIMNSKGSIDANQYRALRKEHGFG